MKIIILIISIHIVSFSQVNINDLVDRTDMDETNRKYLLKDENPFNGVVYFNYSNGKPEFEGFLKDGIQDGHWVWYYNNGVIKQEGEFKNIQHEGLWTTWYKSGQIEQEGEFALGNPRDNWIWITQDGDVQEIEFPSIKWVENRIKEWNNFIKSNP